MKLLHENVVCFKYPLASNEYVNTYINLDFRRIECTAPVIYHGLRVQFPMPHIRIPFNSGINNFAYSVEVVLLKLLRMAYHRQPWPV